MFVSPEWLLAAGLIAIYLFDSVRFLQIGESVVSTRGESLRGLFFGSSFELGGRRPYLPNPLTPWWPELRVDWTTSSRGSKPEQITTEMRQHLRIVQPIARFASMCAALVAVVAPVALVRGDEGIFVASILACVSCAVPVARWLSQDESALDCLCGKRFLSASWLSSACRAPAISDALLRLSAVGRCRRASCGTWVLASPKERSMRARCERCWHARSASVLKAARSISQ